MYKNSAVLYARIFRRKIRRYKHATTFDLALNRNYFYTVLCIVIFSKCEIQFGLSPKFHTYNLIHQFRDNVLNIRRD